MAFTTLSVRVDVAKRLKAAKKRGESFSDLLERLLDNEPVETVGEWLETLKPLEGRGVLTPQERERLRERHAPGAGRKRRRAAA